MKFLIKKALKVILVTACSLLLADATLVVVGWSSLGGMPENIKALTTNLVAANVVLGLVAVVLAFFRQAKGSVLVFLLQCSVLGYAFYTTSFLLPAEKDRELRAYRLDINTNLIADAAIVLECADGYRVAYLAPATTSIGRVVASLNLIPTDMEEEPLQMLSWVDGLVGDVYVKASHQHLEALLPECSNADMTFDELVTLMKNLQMPPSPDPD